MIRAGRDIPYAASLTRMANMTSSTEVDDLATKARRWLDCIRSTPLHPQFFAFKYEELRHRYTAGHCRGLVLDIGSGRQPLRDQLDRSCRYIPLDYPRTGNAYDSKPLVHGDAGQLPFAEAVFDTVVLLEVLEHLPAPKKAMQEACRVLKPNGKLIISTPFIYPIHDAPHDYQRWTQFGIEELSQQSGLVIDESLPLGQTLESSALLFNLGYAWEALNSRGLRRMALLILATVLIPLSNILAMLFNTGRLNRALSPISIGYLCVLRKNNV
ncbi:class I SAM-dependent methyltransferase [Pseudomonas sp. AOB-7]|uniref:class I SAM-dependent methyltransferase n=1 Tax=Pseudomonas sp. AOB-7 TaxID=2482750 RepID=UPI000EFD37C8|nr:class I SAM-dependent methyltransferase [Pseudomonas sp. AOB-7]RMH85299.1 class I SAM-dependent methyltransferase [Pseudomonas sp. AOB-7]